MKVLTVRQPHASLIALGVKTIETRTKPTKYRGPLLIHAGGRPSPATYYSRMPYADAMLDQSLLPDEQCLDPLFEFESTTFGAIVASCKLVDVVPIVRDIDHAYKNETDPKKALTYALPFVVPEFNPFNPGEREPHAGKTLIRVTYRPAGDDRRHTNYWDQLPYGDFTPGRYAWLLEDIKPTTERCPACWGEGGHGRTLMGTATHRFDPCPTCKGSQVTDPIPAKGKPGLWEWNQ